MAQSGTHWIGGKPTVLIFDVNETLIDFEVNASPVRTGFRRQKGHARMAGAIDHVFDDDYTIGPLQRLLGFGGRPV